MTEYGLGRIEARDERDEAFPMRLVLPDGSRRIQRYWSDDGWWGDQEDTPQCVGYSWAHWLEDGPITQAGPAPKISPALIYREAQKVDEWAGEDYDGTSVRAGAKVLTSLGYIGGYTWAWDIYTVIDAILEKGPVVVGTDWYDDMFEPDEDGIVRPTGNMAGGHAYVLNGVSKYTGFFRIKNSWGRYWGKDGHAYIAIDDMANLLDAYGEACLAVEVGVDLRGKSRGPREKFPV